MICASNREEGSRMRKTILLAAVAAALAFAGGTTLASGKDHHGSSGAAEQSHGKAKGAAERQLFAVLRGRNELSGTPLHRGAGDPDGRGGATVTIDGTAVCFGITVTNLDQPILAHIHKGRRHQNGPIVVPLTQPATGDPGASSGCVEAAADLASDIQRHPKRYYVNVHTTVYPAGAIRGQLFGKRR
jgi:hypothetical protein